MVAFRIVSNLYLRSLKNFGTVELACIFKARFNQIARMVWAFAFVWKRKRGEVKFA